MWFARLFSEKSMPSGARPSAVTAADSSEPVAAMIQQVL